MTIEIGIMTIPYYISKLGLMGGVIVIILSGILSIFKFAFIVRASDREQENDYSRLVEKVFPSQIF